ncbi:MAG: peptide chain release factor 1 [Chloroflexi bacterium]|nr:peptide chain release factor 1 [Chloroflexota bacterium]
MLDKLADVERRYEELNNLMGRPDVLADVDQLQRLAREQRGIEEVVGRYRNLRATEQQLHETEQMLREGLDDELVALAREELDTLRIHRERLLEQIKVSLLPRDPNDERDVIVEIRAGTGGDEAALFAADLFRMYSRYAESKRWRVEVVDQNENGIGGFKEIVFEVHGQGAYSRLKYESGVHRVQRVPYTEASGRIHTSTATVAVLPEVDDVEVTVRDDDLKIDTFCSGGAGGQNENKVATAVRITHLPTGLVVTCQDERSQLKNKLKALSVLRARLYDAERRRQFEEVTETRRSQVGTGERAEKIRTYNFPQDRLTDHRIGLTVHNLPAVLDGEIDHIIDAVATADQAERLKEAWAAA